MVETKHRSSHSRQIKRIRIATDNRNKAGFRPRYCYFTNNRSLTDSLPVFTRTMYRPVAN